MASTSATTATNDDRNKTVTGYPIQSRIVTGYPHTPPPPQSDGSRVAVASTFYTTTDVYNPRHQPPPPPPPPTPIIFRLLCALSTIFLLTITGFLIFWLILRPHFPQFQVTSASISAINATSPTSAILNLTILVKNPNRKLTISYDHFQAAVAYNNNIISQAYLPPFRLSKMNQTLVKTQLDLIEANVGSDVVGEIMSWRARGMVEFGVRMISLVRYRTGNWWFRSHFMVVYCTGLYLGFSPANPKGTLLNSNKQCEVAV